MNSLMRLNICRPHRVQYMLHVGINRTPKINVLPTCYVYCNKMTGNTSDNLNQNLKQPAQNFRTHPPYSRRPKFHIEEDDHHLAQRTSANPSLIIEKKTPTSSNNENSTKDTSNEESKQYDINWIFPKQKNPSKLWLFTSQIIITIVGLFSKFVLVFMNSTRVHNLERLTERIKKRPKGQPLITVSNHHSCFDDPGLWGMLPLRYLCNTFKIRWSMAAHDICFTNFYHSVFFMYGKCIPVVRGLGVYQDAVDLCIEKCSLGHWVHVFPEGKVNMTKEEMRLKWGVGRIIYESPKIPLIIPMWHEGMDEVLPNVEPYIIKWGKRVTVNIGEPLDLNDFIQDLKDHSIPESEARKLITDKIQDAFKKIRLETEALHKENVKK